MSTIIKNGTIVTADRSYKADVLIDGERIVEIGESLKGDETIDAMSQRLGISRDILSAQMRLTYLAPDIVRALVLGRPAEGLTPAGLLALCKDLPHDWQLQHAVLGLETR